MRLFITSLIISVSIATGVAQEAMSNSSFSLEYSLGYERLGFTNYIDYGERGNLADADYFALNKGFNIPFSIAGCLSLKPRHSFLLGFYFNLNRVTVNNMSGGIGHVISSEDRFNPTVGIGLRHRYQFIKISHYDVSVENTLILEPTTKTQSYNFRKTGVTWNFGLRVERALNSDWQSFIGVYSGIGLAKSTTIVDNLARKTILGCKVGLAKSF